MSLEIDSLVSIPKTETERIKFESYHFHEHNLHYYLKMITNKVLHYLYKQNDRERGGIKRKIRRMEKDCQK